MSPLVVKWISSIRTLCRLRGVIFLSILVCAPYTAESATLPNVSQKRVPAAQKVDASLINLPSAGSQIPAATDDIIGIQIIPTGTGTLDLKVEYAAADHSDVILLGATPVKDGQHAAGGSVPTPISPGKGKAVVKMKGVYDPFDQMEVFMYLQSDQSYIVKKRFNDFVNKITSVQVTKKTATEYAVGVGYSLATMSQPGAFVGAIPLKNGQMSASFTGNKPVPAQAGNHTAVVNVYLNSSTSTPFDQMKVAIYNSNKDIVTKVVDFGADTSTSMSQDMIKGFKPTSEAITNFQCSVDYAYQSDQGGLVTVTAKVLDNGYPIDWIKCSQDYAAKGNGTAALQCSLNSTQSMPVGTQQLKSNQVLVQMMSEGSTTPLASRTFPFNKIWSLDDLSNFRITGQNGSAINFLVDYKYGSSHGAMVGITAKAIAGGVTSKSVFPATQLLSKGSGTVAGKFPVPAGGIPIEKVYVYMYEAVGQEFYSETFPYTTGSGSASGSVVSAAGRNVVPADKTALAAQLQAPVTASGTRRDVGVVSRQIGMATPPPILNLAAQAVSSGEIRLKWSPQSAGMKEYRIERRVAPAPFALIATVRPMSSEYSDKTVQAGTAYTYRIQVVPDAKAAVLVSNEVVVKTPTEIKKVVLPVTVVPRTQR